MEPDDLKQAWQGQPRPALDAGPLLEEIRRDRQSFASMIFRRDLREVGIAVLMVPLWLYLGARGALPWTWYLTVPALLWVSGFMLVDRIRHRRKPSGPDDPLRRVVEGALAEVEHQIGLLRTVHWWGLLPLAIAMLAFFGQGAWQERGGGWWTVLSVGMVSSLGLGVFAIIYGLNRHAIRADLEPRRRELEAILAGLADEPPGAT
ncbi:hypothetical protein TA3x_002216 [Tundrisphaera sp. TA3]|uniref:hypothetical protein n=1 Tax=Tundrisphaera sp. TA3 TaxID=3435775 RepID=UPI003EBB3F55